MKESYGEDLASRSGLEPYAGGGDAAGVASARGPGRPAIELRNQIFRAPTTWRLGEGDIGDLGKSSPGTAEPQTQVHAWNAPNARTGRFRGFPRVSRLLLGTWNGRTTSPTVQPT